MSDLPVHRTSGLLPEEPESVPSSGVKRSHADERVPHSIFSISGSRQLLSKSGFCGPEKRKRTSNLPSAQRSHSFQVKDESEAIHLGEKRVRRESCGRRGAMPVKGSGIRFAKTKSSDAYASDDCGDGQSRSFTNHRVGRRSGRISDDKQRPPFCDCSLKWLRSNS
jgi:hypothetical protein